MNLIFRKHNRFFYGTIVVYTLTSLAAYYGNLESIFIHIEFHRQIEIKNTDKEQIKVFTTRMFIRCGNQRRGSSVLQIEEIITAPWSQVSTVSYKFELPTTTMFKNY